MTINKGEEFRTVKPEIERMFYNSLRTRLDLPFSEMQPGDHFFVSRDNINGASLKSAAYRVSIRGDRYSVLSEPGGFRVICMARRGQPPYTPPAGVVAPEVKIERGAAAPPQQRKYPFDEMDEGDWFFVPEMFAKATTIRSYASQKSTGGRKFTVQVEDGGCRVICVRAAARSELRPVQIPMDYATMGLLLEYGRGDLALGVKMAARLTIKPSMLFPVERATESAPAAPSGDAAPAAPSESLPDLF